MKYSLTAPTYITLPRKRVKDRTYPLSLNAYRNWHFQVSNQIKEAFKTHMAPQISSLPTFPGAIEIWFDYYPRTRQRSDVGNWISVCEKFFLDALVTLGKLTDDSMHYVPRTHSTFCGVDPDKQGKILITIQEIPKK